MLAVDSSVIYQGVRSKYGENLGKDREKKFFDKIIQVPFSIPMHQYNIKSYLKEFLDEEDEKEIDGYKNAIAGILGNNPRSIKRAFNRLELHKLILKGYIMDAKDRLNLFIILLIQMVEEELYDKLVQVVVQSNDAAEMCELIMKGEEYSIVRNLLELPEFVEAENGLEKINIEGVKEISQGNPAGAIKKEEIGYYYQRNHITLVGIKEDSNGVLLEKIMEFYHIL